MTVEQITAFILQDGVPSIPIAAWQQAVIVVLFVLFVAGVFAFVRWILKFVQALMFQQQQFIVKRDEDWQTYFQERESSFNIRNEEVVKVLRELIDTFQKHAEETHTAIEVMKERTRPLPKRGQGQPPRPSQE